MTLGPRMRFAVEGVGVVIGLALGVPVITYGFLIGASVGSSVAKWMGLMADHETLAVVAGSLIIGAASVIGACLAAYWLGRLAGWTVSRLLARL